MSSAQSRFRNEQEQEYLSYSSYVSYIYIYIIYMSHFEMPEWAGLDCEDTLHRLVQSHHHIPSSLCPASRASHDGDIFLSKFLQQRVEASSLCSSARGISLQSVQCANAWQNLK